MLQLTLKEPSYSPYLYINPETNVVHLLLPIMSSTQDADMEIGLDNTCKSVYSLQEFFGYAGSNQQREALGALCSYQEALEHDLLLPLDEAQKILEQNPELSQKLLITNDIPFTDYSGRTFTCTAYEYA